MYAVIRTGGKQHKVSEGDVIVVEKLPGEAGASVVFDQVLAISDDGGLTTDKDELSRATVRGTILEQLRDDKVTVFKYKKRKGYARTKGHRQQLTRVEVQAIEVEGRAKKAAKPDAAEKPPAAKKPAAKKPAEAAAKKAPAKKAAAKKAPAKKAPAKKAPAKKAAAEKPATKKAATGTPKPKAGAAPASAAKAGKTAKTAKTDKQAAGGSAKEKPPTGSEEG